MKENIAISENNSLKRLLDEAVVRYNVPNFIENDPLSIPHRFTILQDIEITAFWTSMLAWGQRKTIINKANDLFERMDNAPHDFIVNHSEIERKRFETFVHRTFQPTDALYFLAFFQDFYQKNTSLETAFAAHLRPDDTTIEAALVGFNKQFFGLEYVPDRTRKHVASPTSGSSCKRLCMFLRWMVRRDAQGVDFGLWKNISPSQLIMPLDVHVERQARALGLLERPKTDWKAALELTERMRTFDPEDPVKYDFALFGIGVNA